MKNITKKLTLSALALMTAGTLISPVSAAPKEKESEKYIITFEPHELDSKANGVYSEHIKGYVKAFGGEITNVGKELHYAIVKLPNENVAKALENKKEIKAVDKETFMKPSSLPESFDTTNVNTPQGSGWGYDETAGTMKINGVNLTGAGVKVMVIDTGYVNHPDLNMEKVFGNTFWDNHYHGMGSLGVIGAKNNSIGTLGLAPDARMFYWNADSGGLIATTEVIEALDYSAVNGIDIVTMSFGYNHYTSTFESAIAEARSKNILILGSAGNDSSNNAQMPFYPADYAGAYSISAMKEDHSLASYSNYGNVDFAAPTDNPSLGNVNFDGEYYKSAYNGTSAAAPFAAGILALYVENYPDYNLSQLMTEVRKDVKDFDLPVEKVGAGMIDAPYVDHGVRQSDLVHGAKLYIGTLQATATYGQSIGLYSRLMDDPTVAATLGLSGPPRGKEIPFESATIRYDVYNSSSVKTYTAAKITGTDGRHDMVLPITTAAFPTAGKYTIYTRYSYTDPVTAQVIYSFQTKTITIN